MTTTTTTTLATTTTVASVFNLTTYYLIDDLDALSNDTSFSNHAPLIPFHFPFPLTFDFLLLPLWCCIRDDAD